MATPRVALDADSRRYANIFRRLAAYAIDLFLLLLLLLMVGLAGRVLRTVGVWNPAQIAPEEAWRSLGLSLKLLVFVTFFVSVGPLYFSVFHCSPWQATVGKRILNIYVTDEKGERITLARSARRWLAQWVLSMFGGSFVSMVTVGVTRQRRAVHDYLAHTLVLNGKAEPGGRLESWRWLVGFVVPFVWMLGTFVITL